MSLTTLAAVSGFSLFYAPGWFEEAHGAAHPVAGPATQKDPPSTAPPAMAMAAPPSSPAAARKGLGKPEALQAEINELLAQADQLDAALSRLQATIAQPKADPDEASATNGGLLSLAGPMPPVSQPMADIGAPQEASSDEGQQEAAETPERLLARVSDIISGLEQEAARGASMLRTVSAEPLPPLVREPTVVQPASLPEDQATGHEAGPGQGSPAEAVMPEQAISSSPVVAPTLPEPTAAEEPITRAETAEPPASQAHAPEIDAASQLAAVPPPPAAESEAGTVRGEPAAGERMVASPVPAATKADETATAEDAALLPAVSPATEPPPTQPASEARVMAQAESPRAAETSSPPTSGAPERAPPVPADAASQDSAPSAPASAEQGNAAPTRSASVPPVLSPEDRAALLRRAEEQLALGDVAAARLLYRQAAQGGSRRAAAALGRTYEPEFLRGIGAEGVSPDPLLASVWARRAEAMAEEETRPAASSESAAREAPVAQPSTSPPASPGPATSGASATSDAAAAPAPTAPAPAPVVPPSAPATHATPEPEHSPAAVAANPGPAPAPAPPSATAPSRPEPPRGAVAPGLEAVMRRADEMLALRDISAARLLYTYAAEAGSGRAAAALGRTYDPAFLDGIGVQGIRPDPAQAAQWYRRAIALGEGQAAEPLSRLERR